MQIEWKEAKKNTYFLIFSEDDGKIIEQVYLFDRRNNTDPKDIVLYTYYSVGNTVPHTYILSSEPSDEMKSCFGACKVFCNPHMSIEDAKTFVIEQLEQAYLDAAEDCDRKIRKFADEKSEAVRKADYLRSLRVEAVFSESSTEKTIEKKSAEADDGKDHLVETVLSIAKKYNLSAEDLLVEADCVEEYGEWTILPLMGFSAEIIEAAARKLKN